jgi:hypothetical protein
MKFGIEEGTVSDDGKRCVLELGARYIEITLALRLTENGPKLHARIILESGPTFYV